MSPLLTYYLLSFVILAMCAFAFWKGGPAERAGAGVILALMILERGLQLVLPQAWWIPLGLCCDALTALGLLFVALRFVSFWLGGAMLLYAAQFTLHSFYLVTGRKDTDLLHIVVTDLNFVGITICLVVGTILAWRRRRAQRAEAAHAA